MTDFITAEWFCALLTKGSCYACQGLTPLAVVWAPRGVEHDDGERYDIDEPYILRYIEQLNPEAEAFLAQVAPGLRYASTKASGMTYLANHCAQCGAVVGDRYLCEPNGSFWLESKPEAEVLTVCKANVPVRATAGYSMATWMEWIPPTPP